MVWADGTAYVDGWSCQACGYAVAVEAPWCPRCRGELTPRRFGPRGVVWSSTVFRVPLPDRKPPWVLAYVDLDGGPRILAHVDGPARRVPIGSIVELRGRSPHGDPLAVVVDNPREST